MTAMPPVAPGIAIISADSAFRVMVREHLTDAGLESAIVLELARAIAQIDEADVAKLSQMGCRGVVLDVGSDPLPGVRFAAYISERNADMRILAVGPVLGGEQVLDAMRAGISDYLPRPLQPTDLRSALERLTSRLGNAAAGGPRAAGRILTVFSAKGGTGTTTIASSLAVALHEASGKRVLLVDLDLELGESALMLGARPKFNLVDLVQNFHRMDAGLLASYIEKHPSGVELLSAPYQPAKTEMATGDQIRRILQFLRQHYDIIVVDPPKTFGASTLAAFDQAEQVLLVTVADLPSLRNTQRALPLIRRALTPGDEQLKLVVNRYEARDPLDINEIEKTLGLAVHTTLANDYDKVMAAINAGRPVVTDKTSRFTKDLRKLAQTLSGTKSALSGAASNGAGRFLSLKQWLPARKGA